MWEQAEALDRRLSFFAHVSATLASTLDYEATMRGLARSAVPTMGDWCAVHLAGDDGGMRFVSGAHRDPARDLLVRALCEYGERRIPFAEPGDEPRMLEITDDLLRERAQDAEQLKLYRALAPTGVIQAPIRARGRTAGVITLVTAREYGPALLRVRPAASPVSWPSAPRSAWRTRGSTGKRRRRTAATGCCSRRTRSRCGSSTWTPWPSSR